MARFGPIATFAIAICFIGQSQGAQYFGKHLGKLSELHHGVSGEVYAVDGRTLYIKDFTYDGQGPAAYFYASANKAADKSGFRLRDENGSGEVIRRYRKEGVTLTLPEGKTLSNIKIFYVWCEEFDVNFGDVKIPRAFDYPRPQKIQPLEGVHAISSDNIVIVDAQTLLVPNLSYDGEAPDAKFWVGPGTKPSPQGIRVPDENGKEIPLRKYDKKTVVLTLPGDLTVFDIGHFGIWCEQFTVDFGHVVIPHSLNIPPSLKMLGVSPQKLQQVGIASASHSRPLVGGHLQPTTFRPPTPSLFSSLFRRRNDNGLDIGPQHQNAIDIVPQQLVYQQNVQPRSAQAYTSQQYQQFALPVQPSNQQLVYHQPQVQRFHQNQLIHHTVPQFQVNQHNNYQQPYTLQAQSRQSIQLPLNNGYLPLDTNQRQYQEQLLFNNYLHSRKLQEEQIRAQQSRQHNRFDLAQNQNSYAVFG